MIISPVKARALGLGRHQGEDPPAAVGAVAPIAVGDPAQLNAWGQQFTDYNGDIMVIL